MNVEKLKRLSSNDRFKNINITRKERPASSNKMIANKEKIVHYNDNSFKKQPYQKSKLEENKYELFIYFLYFPRWK